ncbi:hypothetical protein PanWU01x14_306990 [Parasponia andersonii]|uniref:Uncharacterized protein n=1 Tax=Parasponia andersonii TaxID=3476 RepID=A0A2P5ARK4_PARAD|nr:hypothetical protein PanWU01x14_306990 [Parasponia andersonii]
MPLWISASSVSKLSQRPSRSSTCTPNMPKLDSSRDTLVSKLVIISLDLPQVVPFITPMFRSTNFNGVESCSHGLHMDKRATKI